MTIDHSHPNVQLLDRIIVAAEAGDASDLFDLDSAYDAIEKDVLSGTDDVDVYSALEPDLPPLEAEDLDYDVDLSPSPVRAAPPVDLPPAAARVAPDAKDVDARRSAEGPAEATSADGMAVEIVGEDEPVAAGERTETPAVAESTKV